MMRLVSTLALGAALGLVAFATPATAQRAAQPAAPAAGKLKLSKAFADAFNVVNDALIAKNVAAAKSGYANIVATTDDERYQMGLLGVVVGNAAQDNAMITSAADLVINSAAAKPADKARYLFFKGAAAADPKQGVLMMQQAYDQGFQAPGVEASLAASYYKAGDVANGDSWIKRIIDKEIAAGRSPAVYYGAAMVENVKVNNLPAALAWSKLLTGISLAPPYWNVAIAIARRANPGSSAQADLDLLRLLRRTNALSSFKDYQDYIQAADPNRLPGEVTDLIAEGKAKGILKGTEPFIVDVNGLASKRIASDKESLTNIAKEAAAAKDGVVAQGGGDAMLGYGQYAEAASLYQTALSKGGVDANRINVRLGIAKASAGDTTGAEAAFKSVASSPWKMVADYWLIYLQAKAKNVPTTIPPAAS